MAKQVQSAQASTVPADVDDEYKAMLEATKGQGISKAQEDNLVPLITIFQTGSKAVNRAGGRM